MVLIGYAIWIGIVFAACYWLGADVGKPSRARSIFFASLGIVLVLLPYWDVILGAPAMRRACREQAGLQTYESVEFPLPSVLIKQARGSGSSLSCFEILIRGLALETQAEIR